VSYFDRIAALALLVLGLMVAGAALASARLGPSVDTFATAHLFDGTAVGSEIGITFTEPMDTHAVERAFHISPATKGDFSWAGNELLFLPRRPLAYNCTYTITVGQGARDTGGRHLFRPYRVRFTTQSEHLLYVATAGHDRGHLVLQSLGGRREPVGTESGTVVDFSVSSDRATVVYSMRRNGASGATEIWLLSMADNSTQRVFARSDWTISQPHFSPDGRSIVFLATNVKVCQKFYGCYRDHSGPVIEILDIASHRVHAFASSSDVPITNFIAFSPAGDIAYTDLGSALTLASPNGSRIVHIPNMGNSLEFTGFDSRGDRAAFVGQTPTSTGGDVLVYSGNGYLDVSRGIYDSASPSFSQTGSEVAFAAYRAERGIEPVYGIATYSFKSHIRAVLTRNTRKSDWQQVFAPDDRYIAFVQSVPQEAMYMGSGAVWVMRADGSHAHALGGIGESVTWVA
jgi:Tol biopolymer transport system component